MNQTRAIPSRRVYFVLHALAAASAPSLPMILTEKYLRSDLEVVDHLTV